MIHTTIVSDSQTLERVHAEDCVSVSIRGPKFGLLANMTGGTIQVYLNSGKVAGKLVKLGEFTREDLEYLTDGGRKVVEL